MFQQAWLGVGGSVSGPKWRRAILTNADLLFIGPKGIYFYEIIFAIQTRKYVLKSHL